ncbi:class I SAM-dependent methyltransferase [Paraconexibacter antarcticus]|uniref:Class I SAM-dependent methyltransferase n=1 Tax=Paraconexibacter antarcticus TaxID=2949664 RepID=A0ABY5DU51_9ACTN|nr:class I SAM-dependent methyltransferase [Paraconexibacter antarcticus]UTI64227.1 class I SAM-dependent methyltransferase [Paraconexibacter antarcticus]
MTTAPYDALVASYGLSAAHRLMADAVPPGSRVLDVGCSTGYLAAVLGATGCQVVGIEQDEGAAGRARARDALSAVLTGSVDDEDVRARAAEHGPYDAIVCGDVLEHLPDPEATLRALATQLAPGGRVVVSVPNIAHWTGRRALVRGRFPRAEHGLFDATHLRWFTRSSAHDLVTAAGLRVTGERFSPAPLPLQAHWPSLGRLEGLATRLRPELFALQVVLVGER